MEFDKFVNGATITVMYVLWGGPANSFDGLSSMQQSVFFKEMQEVSNPDSLSIEELYMKYAHESDIAIPRYIHVADKDGVIYSAPIISLPQTMMNIKEKVKGDIYMWNKYRLELHLRLHKVMTGEEIYPAQLKAIEDAIHFSFHAETLETIIAIAGMPVEPIEGIQGMLNSSSIDRMREMCNVRTSFMLKIAGC